MKLSKHGKIKREELFRLCIDIFRKDGRIYLKLIEQGGEDRTKFCNSFLDRVNQIDNIAELIAFYFRMTIGNKMEKIIFKETVEDQIRNITNKNYYLQSRLLDIKDMEDYGIYKEEK